MFISCKLYPHLQFPLHGYGYCSFFEPIAFGRLLLSFRLHFLFRLSLLQAEKKGLEPAVQYLQDMNWAYRLSANYNIALYGVASNIVCAALPKYRYSLPFLLPPVINRVTYSRPSAYKYRPFVQKLCLPFCCHRGLSNGEKPLFTGFFTGVMLLCKPLYSLWGNFCYPLSVFFKFRIKLRFYCQKSSVYRAFGHRKSDLKDCSSRSLMDIKIYTLQDNGCCTITLDIIPTRSL